MQWTETAQEAWDQRLTIPGESPEQAIKRVATAVFHDDEQKALKLVQRMNNGDFFPNSPALRNLGDPDMPGLPHACFVQSIHDSLHGIYMAIHDEAIIFQAGGGMGHEWSTIRPKGWPVRSTKGVASGPISFMKVSNLSVESVKQGGMRRGAKMATCWCYHPDIIDFVTMKADRKEMQNFNVSVLVDDTFFAAVEADDDICLQFPCVPGRRATCANPGEHEHLSASGLLDCIVTMAHENGEPGLLFVDRANEDNPHPELYTLTATNPCGEQWLGPNESCVLGSINVANYYLPITKTIDYTRLRTDVFLYVETLDRMIDVAKYPLPAIEIATKHTRRIGLGVMGFGDLLYKLEIPYDSNDALGLAMMLGQQLKTFAHDASAKLAETYGTYPAWNGSVPTRRNAAVTTVAPTGTLSILANCSSGIEPIFALHFERRHRMDKHNPDLNAVFTDRNSIFQKWQEANPDAVVIPSWFVTAHEVSPEYHVRMQAVWQKYFADNSISKTINAPREATVDDAKASALLAHQLRVKGWTYYRDGSREGQVLTPTADCGGIACSIESQEVLNV